MRYLVLTDIHANLEALEACLADAQGRYGQTLVLGDLVGYGGDPNAVVELVQSLEPIAIVRGNHDKVACGLEQAEGFNAVAKSAGDAVPTLAMAALCLTTLVWLRSRPPHVP